MKIKPEFVELVRSLRQLAKNNVSEFIYNKEITPMVKTLAANSSWIEDRFFQVDKLSGFTGHKIHVESDYTLAIYVTAWMPCVTTLPHNHGTWAISASVISVETHQFWRRIDSGEKPGYAVIVEEEKITCQPSEVVFISSDKIHSVVNESKEIALSLQLYGKHPNFTDRIQINPLTNEVSTFIANEA